MSPTSDKPRESRLVLLAEDDEDLRLALGDVLDANGYEPLLAADGSSALAMSSGHHLHAAIVDLNLPGTGGARVMEELLRRDATLRAIMMSGEHSAKVPEGAVLLPKPFAVDTLLAVLLGAVPPRGIPTSFA